MKGVIGFLLLLVIGVGIWFAGNSMVDSAAPYTEKRTRTVIMYDVKEVYDEDYDTTNVYGYMQDKKLGFTFTYPITQGQFQKFIADGQTQELWVHNSLERLGYDKSPSGRIAGGWAFMFLGVFMGICAVAGAIISFERDSHEKKRRQRRQELDRRYYR